MTEKNIQSNAVVLQYAIESTELPNGRIGLLVGETGAPAGTPEWNLIRYTSIGNIGPVISTVASDDVSDDRQEEKGSTSDLDSAAEFDANVTLSNFLNFAEGFVFARRDGAEVYDPASSDADSFTVATGSVLSVGSLVYGRGWTNSANNGIHVVNGVPTATDIPVASTLVAETAPDNATVEVAGFRLPATASPNDIDVVVSGTTVTITVNTAGFSFLNAGLNMRPGSAIYFPPSGTPNLNSFATAGNSGCLRLRSVTASTIVCDKSAQQWTNESIETPVDMLIGVFIRNVAITDSLFLERSFQFEISYPGLGTTGDDEYEYSKGNYCNTWALNYPLTDKATMSPAFIGIDTDPPTATRKTGADTPSRPQRTAIFNTSLDCVKLRIQGLDETGLTTDFKSVTININNNVSPEKVLCRLGAAFMNFGNFQVSVEGQALFTNSAVVSAIRNNTTLTMDFMLKNDDGGIYYDIPSLTLGNGAKDFPTNESVLINLTGSSFRDPTFNTSIGITVFPFIP